MSHAALGVQQLDMASGKEWQARGQEIGRGLVCCGEARGRVRGGRLVRRWKKRAPGWAV
jgi:hypothetical protein